ncbi:MAG: hypothetical protein AAF479_15930 [Pseudomonadota bacterium]
MVRGFGAKLSEDVSNESCAIDNLRVASVDYPNYTFSSEFDSIDGGAGNDTIFGGASNDTLDAVTMTTPSMAAPATTGSHIPMETIRSTVVMARTASPGRTTTPSMVATAATGFRPAMTTAGT